MAYDADDAYPAPASPINLQALAGSVLRRWKLVGTVWFGVLLVAYAGLKLLPSQYVSAVEILVFDPAQQMDSQVQKPVSPFVDALGNDAMDTIVIFDPKGKFVRSFGKSYYPGGHGIDLRKEDGQEYLYLSDIHNRQVIKTDLKGKEVWKLDYPKEPGVYKDKNGYRPTNVAFAPDGGFSVGDGYGSHYIHQYDKDAKWVRTWGGEFASVSAALPSLI